MSEVRKNIIVLAEGPVKVALSIWTGSKAIWLSPKVSTQPTATAKPTPEAITRRQNGIALRIDSPIASTASTTPSASPKPVRQMQRGQQIHVLAAGRDPGRRDLVAQGREPAGEAHLRNDSEDEAGDKRAQVAGGGEHQQPAGTAAGEHHAHAEQEPAEDGPGPGAGNGHHPGVLGPHPPQQVRGLHPDDRRGEGQQPDRDPRPETAAGEFDGRGAQAELRALCRHAEQHASDQPE